MFGENNMEENKKHKKFRLNNLLLLVVALVILCLSAYFILKPKDVAEHASDTTAGHVDVPDGLEVEQTDTVKNARYVDVSTGEDIEPNYDIYEEYVLYSNSYTGAEINGFNTVSTSGSNIKILDTYLGVEDVTNSNDETTSWVYGYIHLKNESDKVVIVGGTRLECLDDSGKEYITPTGMPIHVGTNQLQLGPNEEGYVQVMGIFDYKTYGISADEFKDIQVNCEVSEVIYDVEVMGKQTEQLKNVTTEICKTNIGSVELRTTVENTSDRDWELSVWYYLFDSDDNLIGLFTGQSVVDELKSGNTLTVSVPATYPYLLGKDQFDISRVEERCWIYYIE